MKLNRSVLLATVLLLLTATLYRVWGGRPYGFAPQIAMAIFAGSMIRNRKLAILIPLLSMLVSDTIYQVLYVNGLSTIKGFYSGQWLNYTLIAGLIFFGMLIKRRNAGTITLFSISGSLLYFLASNFTVWLGGGGFGRPQTFTGLMQCYGDAVAFYRDYGLFKGFAGNIFIGDLFFCAILFGSYYLLNQKSLKPAIA